MRTAEELLGMFIDLSAESKPTRHLNTFKSGPPTSRWECKFCHDFAKTPDKIEHKHGCIVAQAQSFFRAKYDHDNLSEKSSGVDESLQNLKGNSGRSPRG